MSDSYTFNDWLDTTLHLQRTSFGINPPSLVGEEQADYIRWNVLAATDELHEFLQECPVWKPWSSSIIINRDAAVGELVDSMHFIANLLVMLGVTGEELTDRYKAKQAVNKKRQEDGYTGNEKCPGCKRDLSEVPIIVATPKLCGACGSELTI